MQPALPVLYSFRRCPYAIRARLGLLSAGVTVELREVDLKRKPAELLALSPAATVPVLNLGAGKVLVHSLDILRWALQQHDPEGWLGAVNEPLAQQLVHTTDTDFKRWLDRYKYAERFPERSAAEWRADAVRCLIDPLEAWLVQHPHIGGARRCWADAAVFPFVRQFAAVDAAWWATAPFPATRRWLGEWLDSTVFGAAMQKVPMWVPGAPPHAFGPLAAQAF
ncbi:MAG: glutathione S-transferase [Hydrogenophaga sp.]